MAADNRHTSSLYLPPSCSGGPRSRLVVGAVMLAAGSASRMGHRPKSLLSLGGVPLIRRQLTALCDAGVDEVVVVLGHYADEIEPVVRDFPLTLVRNPDPDAGQVSSLRAGLQALSPRIDSVLVALADQPLVTAQDISDLVCAYKQRPGGVQVVQPAVDGQPGNPVMFTREVREQILAGDASMGCRQWQAAHPDQVLRWPTTNSHYRLDLDTPGDLAAFERLTGHVLAWPPGASLHT